MITGVFRSPDGKLILYAIGPHLHFVNALTLAELGTFEVESYSISTVFFSADGRLAAVVPAGGQIPVIDLADRHVIAKLDGGEIGVDVKFTPDDRYAVSAISWIVSGGTETNIEVWDLNQGQLVATLVAPGSGADRTLSFPALSPDGKLVAAGATNNNVYVWSIPAGELKFSLSGHVAQVTAVGFSPSGRLLASGGDDGVVRLWDAASGRLVQIITGLRSAVTALAFLSDGAQLRIRQSDGTAQIYTLASGQLSPGPYIQSPVDPFVEVLHKAGYSQGHSYNESNPFAFSPDGHGLAVGSDAMLLWNVDSSIASRVFEGLPDYAKDMAFSSDGRRLAATLYGGNLRVWDVSTAQIVFSATQQSLANAALSPDGKNVILDSADGLMVWNIDNAHQAAALNFPKSSRINGATFSKDGRQVYVVAGDNNVIETWDLATSTMLGQIHLPVGSSTSWGATALHWPMFARNNGDGVKSWIELWNLDSSQSIKLDLTSYGAQPLRFSLDGRLLVGLVNDQLIFWRTDTGQIVFTTAEASSQIEFALSPNSDTLVVGRNGIASLFDISRIHAAALLPQSSPMSSATPAPTSSQEVSPVQTVFPTLALTPVSVPVLPTDALSPDNSSQVVELAHFGHGTVSQAEWSRDGRTITVVGSLGAYQYSADTLSETAYFTSSAQLFSSAERLGGPLLVADSGMGRIRVWDIRNGQVITDVADSGAPVLSPDGRLLAYPDNFGFLTWDLSVGQHGGDFASETDRDTPIVFSPDGRLVAQIQRQGSARLWDVHTGQIVDALGSPDGSITQLAFSRDGRKIAGAVGGAVWLWDVRPGGAPQTYTVYLESAVGSPSRNQVTAVELSPDDKLIATGTSERDILLLDRQSHAVLARLQGLAGPIKQLSFSPDGERLLAVDADGTLGVWNVATGQLLNRNSDHTGHIGGLEFRVDGMLSAWEGNTAWVVRPADGALIKTTSIFSGTIFAASPDGKQLAVYTPYHMTLWDADSGALRQILSDDALQEEVNRTIFRDFYQAVYSADSSRLVVVGAGGAWMYAVANGDLLKQFPGLVPIWVAVAPDQNRLAFCDYLTDCTPSIWDANTGQPVQAVQLNPRAQNVEQLEFTPDGRRLAGYLSAYQTPGKFMLWDVASGRVLGHVDLPDVVLTRLALSSDGRLAALGQEDGGIALVDMTTLKVVARLPSRQGAVSQLAFSRDGRYLASSGAEGVVRIWGIP